MANPASDHISTTTRIQTPSPLPRRLGRYHFSFGQHTPIIELSEGESRTITCPDCDGTFSDSARVAAPLSEGHDSAMLFPGNPLAGPFVLNGLVAGDTLAVFIYRVHLDSPTGITLLAPNHGLLTSNQASGKQDLPPPSHLYRWQLDHVAQCASLINPQAIFPLTVPLRPFIGCIGTCPPDGQPVSSLFAGRFGGNLDLPSITADTIVLLPVYASGGQLFFGDIHAAQGHGEVIGGGIETSGNITFHLKSLSRQSHPAFDFPRILTPDMALAASVASDLRIATQEAFANLLSWLTSATSLNRFDLLSFLSQTVTFEVGNSSPQSTVVAACIKRNLLPPDTFNSILE